ncbi:hypothetical protein ScPMuIL_006592 [Solemya velum]
MDDDEIEVIQSIHCLPGECEVNLTSSSKEIRIRLQSSSGLSPAPLLSLTATFTITIDYPVNPPEIFLSSDDLSREDLSQIRRLVELESQCHLGCPMLFPLIARIQKFLDSQTLVHNKPKNTHVTALSTGMNRGDNHLCLLHLDHMRAKSKYIKTIEKWTRDLNLNGRLLFFKRLILIIIEGDHSSIKEYITRQRSVNVDVDSHGHSCKERMLSVLCEKEVQEKRFLKFQVQECSDIKELHEIFNQCALTEMFESNISPFRGKYF